MTVAANNRDSLTILERIFEVFFSLIAALFLLGFFFLHQAQDTGFLTAEFGGKEMLALYGPILLGLLPPLVRGLVGTRNPARPLEAVANAGMAIGSFWLFLVFPFDFSHLADVLPVGVQFLFGWLTDGIGRIILLLQVLIGAIATIAVLVKFVAVTTARNE